MASSYDNLLSLLLNSSVSGLLMLHWKRLENKKLKRFVLCLFVVIIIIIFETLVGR